MKFLFYALFMTLSPSSALQLDDDCSAAPISCDYNEQLACMNGLQDSEDIWTLRILCVPKENCELPAGATYTATQGDDTVLDHTFTIGAWSDCKYMGRTDTQCITNDDCDGASDFVCAAEVKDRVQQGNKKCVDKRNCNSQNLKTKTTVVCSGFLGDSCPNGRDSECDQTLGNVCAVWLRDGEYQGFKCAANDSCDGTPFPYQQKYYTANCNGFEGDNCTTNNDCNSVLNLTCADLWVNNDFNGTPRCINTSNCDQAHGHNQSNGFYACYPGPYRGGGCNIHKINDGCALPRAEDEKNGIPHYACASFQIENSDNQTENITTQCIDDKYCTHPAYKAYYFGQVTTIICASIRNVAVAILTLTIIGFIYTN